MHIRIYLTDGLTICNGDVDIDVNIGVDICMFYIVHSGDYLFVFHLCILLVSGDIYEVYVGHISDTYIGYI